MKAKRTKTFPIFKMTDADECPECLSVLMSFDGKRVICAACAADAIGELQLALKVAQGCRNTGILWAKGSGFDKRIKMLLSGKFSRLKK